MSNHINYYIWNIFKWKKKICRSKKLRNWTFKTLKEKLLKNKPVSYNMLLVALVFGPTCDTLTVGPKNLISRQI